MLGRSVRFSDEAEDRVAFFTAAQHDDRFARKIVDAKVSLDVLALPVVDIGAALWTVRLAALFVWRGR